MEEEYIQNASAQSFTRRGGLGRFTRNILGFFMPFLEVIKIAIAAVASVVLLGVSCVTLAGTAVAFAVSAPLYLLFSPVLVPATVATAVLATGLTAGGGLGGGAFDIIKWIIKKRLGIGSMALAHNLAENQKRKGHGHSHQKSRGESILSKIPVVGDRLAGENKSKDKGRNKSQGESMLSKIPVVGDRLAGEKDKSRGRKDKSKSNRGHGGSMSGSEGGMSSGSGGGMSGSEGGMSSGSGGGRGGRGH